MTIKTKNQFGVWMDSRHAVVLGRENGDSENFVILGQADNPGPDHNTSENTKNNHEITLTNKYFKEIAALLTDADEIHVTGTGQIQEQFLKFLADTPQYKNANSSDSTSTKMNGPQLIEFFQSRFN